MFLEMGLMRCRDEYRNPSQTDPRCVHLWPVSPVLSHAIFSFKGWTRSVTSLSLITHTLFLHILYHCAQAKLQSNYTTRIPSVYALVPAPASHPSPLSLYHIFVLRPYRCLYILAPPCLYFTPYFLLAALQAGLPHAQILLQPLKCTNLQDISPEHVQLHGVLECPGCEATYCCAECREAAAMVHAMVCGRPLLGDLLWARKGLCPCGNAPCSG